MGRSTGRSRHRHYDHAADMYSLGIVAFEVAHAPWDTAMERVEHIQALRRAGDRPAAAEAAPGVFAADADATVAALVVALVRQDPGERPGAAALLEGPLLPARAELERPLLERATAALRNPLSETRGVLVDALFDAPTPEVVDLGFDASDDDGAKPAARRRRAAARGHDFGVAPARRRLAAAKLERAVVALLERHGCVPFDAPLLRPRPPPRGDGGDGDGGVPLLDARGAVLLLPDESTSGFARRVARRALARPHFGACRRYAAGRVFAARPGARGAARPRERREIAFDAVWKSTTGLGGPHQTSELSISIKSKPIRLIFGRIDCSRRVLEAQPKSLRRNCRIAHIEVGLNI